ncbi:MAG: hypothetical protein ABIR70_11515 [Bryobacteraceae bacterium]
MSRPKRHPEEYTDTDPRTMQVWLEMQRQMPLGKKLANVLGASQFVLQAYEMGVRQLHPEASDEEVTWRVAARHLPRELVMRAYGWDPQNEKRCV